MSIAVYHKNTTISKSLTKQSTIDIMKILQFKTRVFLLILYFFTMSDQTSSNLVTQSSSSQPIDGSDNKDTHDLIAI